MIFADGFESGSFSAWSSATTDGGDLSVTGAAAIAGSYGMQALIDDNNAIYVTDQTPTAAPRYRARFHFDPNSIAMAEGNAHHIFYGYMGTSTLVLRVELRRYYGDYEIRASMLNDSTGWNYTSWQPIRDQMHSIELDWRAASGSGANNGRLTMWLDGQQRADLTGWDNDTRRIDFIRLGPVADIDTGTRGTYYFDAFESRSESAIGPDPTAPEFDLPPEVIFGDAFETGDLVGWSSTTTDGGDLSVATDAALVGVYGLKAVLDDNNSIYVTDWSPVDEPEYHGRFYLDPNGLPMGNGTSHHILNGYVGSTNKTAFILVFQYQGGAYSARLSALTDSLQYADTAWAPVSDAPHYLEVGWGAATRPGAMTDGSAFPSTVRPPTKCSGSTTTPCGWTTSASARWRVWTAERAGPSTWTPTSPGGPVRSAPSGESHNSPAPAACSSMTTTLRSSPANCATRIRSGSRPAGQAWRRR